MVLKYSDELSGCQTVLYSRLDARCPDPPTPIPIRLPHFSPYLWSVFLFMSFSNFKSVIRVWVIKVRKYFIFITQTRITNTYCVQCTLLEIRHYVYMSVISGRRTVSCFMGEEYISTCDFALIPIFIISCLTCKILHV